MGFSFFKFMSFGSKREMWVYFLFLALFGLVVGYCVFAFSTPDFSRSSSVSTESKPEVQYIQIKIVDDFFPDALREF